MLFIISIIIIIVIFYLLHKYKIKWRTFFRKKLKIKKDNWGVALYYGKQGSGKTYSVTEYLLENKKCRIFANFKSLKNVNYTYFEGLEGLLALQNETDCIIVFDEIFTAISKNKSLEKEVLAFLSQMRKRRIYFISTAQEWLELNMTLRRYCRYAISCKIINIPLIKTPILIKEFYDATQMSWSQEANEYVAPLNTITISKLNKIVGQMYDTLETIPTK